LKNYVYIIHLHYQHYCADISVEAIKEAKKNKIRIIFDPYDLDLILNWENFLYNGTLLSNEDLKENFKGNIKKEIWCLKNSDGIILRSAK